MLVPLTILATTQLLGLPPYNTPVPFVAEIVAPTTMLVVVLMPVIVQVQGPVPVIFPTVPPAITMLLMYVVKLPDLTTVNTAPVPVPVVDSWPTPA